MKCCRSILGLILLLCCLACSGAPDREEAGAIIERSSTIMLMKPVSATAYFGPMSGWCSSLRDSPSLYAAMEDLGMAKAMGKDDIELTTKGRDFLKSLGVTPFSTSKTPRCTYEAYLIPLGGKKQIKVTGLAKMSDASILAKYETVVDLNELGRDLSLGSDFCKKYLDGELFYNSKTRLTCPDSKLPNLSDLNHTGKSSVDHREATLVKFDDGWHIR